MAVKARRTVRIPLDPSDADARCLHATHLPYLHCQHRAVEYCWPTTPKRPSDLITDKGEVEEALYDELREETDGLHSNLVQKAIKDAVSAVSSCQTHWENGDRISKPSFDVENGTYARTYDKRAATYHRHEVSLATVDGRVGTRYVLPRDLEGTPYARYVIDRRWSFSTSKLVWDGERFWLHAVMKRTYTDPDVDAASSDTHSGDFTRVLGVDLNVDGSTAVTSVGGFHGNADHLNHCRREYEALRAELQQTDTHSAHLRMRERRGVEWRHYDQYCHDVANRIVADAVRVNATHVVFEKLTRIRRRISNLPKFQQWMFDRIQRYVGYKLEKYSIKCERVKPRNTSKACSRTDCDCIDGDSRDGKRFCCVECGYEVNADYNAVARNQGFLAARQT
jgi:IS605 OrfB family transposase